MNKSNHSLPSLMSSISSFSTASVSSSQRMKRRRAGVSHDHDITCYSKHNEIEGGKSLKRRAVRRYAITKYSHLPLNYMKSLRKTVELEEDLPVLDSNESERLSPDDDRLIVFDLQNKLEPKAPGSEQFLSLIGLYYKEKYQYAESDTHKSILWSVILDEMKIHGYKFVRKDILHPGHFYQLDDLHVVKLIKAQLSLERMKNTYYANSA